MLVGVLHGPNFDVLDRRDPAIYGGLSLPELVSWRVHLSDIENRDDWRRHTVIADIAAHRVIGKGPDGYWEALEFLTRE